MLLSIAVNHSFGLAIAGSAERERWWLAGAVVTNLVLLGWFKYANFAVDNLNTGLAGLGLPPIVLDPVHLPLGISFFTFQALSYVVDVYRREVPAQRRLGSFGLYVASFPQLVTGPIVRYHDVAAEIDQRVMGGELFVSGIRRFIVGLAKKMLIAYPLGEAADQIFALPGEELGTATAWLGIVCYTLQIYFDFSAYSDMAIGLGRMLGFRFLENFNYPYIARSIQSIRSGFRRLSRPGLSSLAREAGASRAGLRSWSFVTREEKPERHFRDVATRYDKLDCRYEAFIAAASMLIWLA